MKKFGFIILGFVLILTSCEVRRPRADFEPTKYVVEPYEEIVFLNYSSHADIYDWDFGDYYYSSAVEPAHYYTNPGTYTVKLTAINGDYEDVCYVDVEVVPSTTLDVQVLEYDRGYPVAGAQVDLYRTYDDWLDRINKVATAYTDADGIAIIDHLTSGYYYMDIWERYHNNEQLGIENSENVMVFLEPRVITQITTYVDYEPPTSSLKSSPAKRQANTASGPKRIRIPHERK